MIKSTADYCIFIFHWPFRSIRSVFFLFTARNLRNVSRDFSSPVLRFIFDFLVVRKRKALTPRWPSTLAATLTHNKRDKEKRVERSLEILSRKSFTKLLVRKSSTFFLLWQCGYWRETKGQIRNIWSYL